MPHHKSVIIGLLVTNNRGYGFTKNQKQYAVHLVKQYILELNTELKMDITPLLENPTLRLPTRELASVNKSINIEKHPVWGQALVVNFPYDASIVLSIKTSKTSDPRVWDNDRKCWLFSLTENHISLANHLVSRHQFVATDAVTNLIAQTTPVLANTADHIPMITVCDGVPAYRNVANTVPSLNASNAIAAAFAARASGVIAWDSKFSLEIETTHSGKLVKDFLKTADLATPYIVKAADHAFDEVCQILDYCYPVMVLIPGGSELAKTRLCVESLQRLGVNPHEMSVLFRLPSNTDREFNQYVKDTGLNSPISETTRVVFISGKLPKPVLASGIKFNSVVNMGWLDCWPRRTVNLTAKNCQNIIHYRD